MALGADPELMVVAREDGRVGVDLLAGTVRVATGCTADEAAIEEEAGVQVVVAEVVAVRRILVSAGEIRLLVEAVVGADVVTVGNLELREDLRGGAPVPRGRAQFGGLPPPEEVEQVARSVASALAVARRAHIGRGELMVIAGLEVDLGDRRLSLETPVEDRIGDDVRVGIGAGPPDPVVEQLGVGREEPGTISVDRAAQRGLVVVDELVGTVEFGVVAEFADPGLVLSDVVEVAMEHIGARLDHRVDRCRLGAPVLGAAPLGMNLRCGNLRGRHSELEYAVVAGDLTDIDAVDVHRASVSRPTHEAVEHIHLLGAGVGWQHRQTVDVVPADERRQLGGLGIDPRRRSGLVLVDHGRFRDDLDLLGFVSAQGEVDGAALTGVESDCDPVARAQAVELGADGKDAIEQQAEAELPGRVADCVLGVLLSDKLHTGARQWVSLGVEHAAFDDSGPRTVGPQRQGRAGDDGEDPDAALDGGDLHSSTSMSVRPRGWEGSSPL